MMTVNKVSLLSGKKTSMDLNTTPEQIERWLNGELIQNVMPKLSSIEREFLISGMDKEEQRVLFCMPFDEWFDSNETDIESEIVSSGADRELDFDSEKYYDDKYEQYLKTFE